MTENEVKVIKHINDLSGDYKCYDEKLTHEEALLLDKLLSEIQAYQAIGTIEEFKALKEKAEPKKPNCISEIDDNSNADVECPVCHANSDYAINRIKSGHCWRCGQKLDWS